MTDILSNLPTLIATSVVRGSDKGQSHGGVYTIDLARQRVKQRIDWNTSDIDFSGTGSDRGLRGIEFFEREIFIAASDQLFCYSPDFKLVAAFRNPYLRHCHEISRRDNILFLTSTAYDCLLTFDLLSRTFVQGIFFSRKDGRWSARPFDPMSGTGPKRSNVYHINMVHVARHKVYLSGLHTRSLLHLHNDMSVKEVCDLPAGTHNAQPFGNGVIYNDTRNNSLAYLEHGVIRCNLPIIRYPKESLQCVGVDDSRIARQAFARGLCALDDRYVVGGSSPSTISVYDLWHNRRVASVNLTSDVRNAIHGLEVCPLSLLPEPTQNETMRTPVSSSANWKKL
jgi:hypothetical protein